MNEEIFQEDHDSHPPTVETDEELSEYLGDMATQIGWVIIYFNSLESQIAQHLRELMLRDAYQDQRLDVFLAEMGFQAKVKALIHLYGHATAAGQSSIPTGELVELEKALFEAATIRNGYAHADWIGLRANQHVRVKARSSRNGVLHRYKMIDQKVAQSDMDFIDTLRDRVEAVHEIVERGIHGTP